MKEAVKRKIAKIEEFYPPERLTKSKERIERLWKNLPPADRLPFTAFPIALDTYNASIDFEKRLHEHLDEFIRRGRFGDDFIPAFSLGCRQGSIPSMFGADEVVVGEDYSCEKIIHSLEDAKKLPEAKLTSDMVAYKWVEMAKYFIEETNGKIPVHVCDMQGPLDVAGKIWGYDNLYMAALDDPDTVHDVLNKTADAFICLWNAQKNAIGDDLFIGTHLTPFDWIPADNGATASVDSMVMVSPDFFDEFYNPALTKISKEYGGLVIHACGWFNSVIPAINKIPLIKGVHASQMKVTEMMADGVDKEIMILSADDVMELVFELNKKGKQKVYPYVRPWPNIGFHEWTEDEWSRIEEYESKILELA